MANYEQRACLPVPSNVSAHNNNDNDRNPNSSLNKEIEERVKAFASAQQGSRSQPTDEEFLELENAVRELRSKYPKNNVSGSIAGDDDDGEKSNASGSGAGGGGRSRESSRRSSTKVGGVSVVLFLPVTRRYEVFGRLIAIRFRCAVASRR